VLASIDRKFGLRKKFVEPFVPNINPNIVSAAGFLTGPLAGVFLWTGQTGLALLFVLLNALSDLLDGAIARKYKKVTKVGSLIDDLADRVSDISISMGLGGMAGSPLLGTISAVLLVLNSYLSLQGLALFGEKAKFGLFSRANRTAAIILFLIGGLALGRNLATPLLYLMIFGALFTILERTHSLFRRNG
jgi:phosphatidylglycerophosphate synthase